MKNRFEIGEYFSDKELIKVLCRKRAVLAKKGHDKHFYRNISRSAVSPNVHLNNEIFLFFPPRKNWLRLNKRERDIRYSNAVETNAIQLERTVWREIKRYKKSGELLPGWLSRLLNFTEKIRNDVFDESRNYSISTPRIIPVLKDMDKNTYRPICVFELNDLILSGQIARYLSNCFDLLFSNSSYAFRTGIRKDKRFNHHNAIENIIDFKRKSEKPLFVAECDIKKFYDCVNHKVISMEFESMCVEAKGELGIEIDSRAIYFFYSYLASFSFNDNIKKKEVELLRNVGVNKGSIPWVEDSELLEVGSNSSIERIGVPQGGAISCLIANMLLNHVDRVVTADQDGNTFYGRFCDDMVLIHPDKKICESLLEKYQMALKDVKLISHQPLKFNRYGKGFWHENLKSKLPYKWTITYPSKDKLKRNVPWLSFVGYQIRYDGVVRIRSKSIRKELKKQVSETDKIISIARRSPRINRRAIKFRLQQRLISMSVGRIRFGPSRSSMCWCAGFKVLKTNPILTNQIRRLDRNREKQLKRLELFLRGVNTPKKISTSEIRPLRYYGHKYSYNGQFVK